MMRCFGQMFHDFSATLVTLVHGGQSAGCGVLTAKKWCYFALVKIMFEFVASLPHCCNSYSVHWPSIVSNLMPETSPTVTDPWSQNLRVAKAGQTHQMEKYGKILLAKQVPTFHPRFQEPTSQIEASNQSDTDASAILAENMATRPRSAGW